MSSVEDLEKARAGSEAREAMERKARSTSSTAMGAALRRYLAVEQYRHLRAETEKGTRCEQDLPVSDTGGQDT